MLLFVFGDLRFLWLYHETFAPKPAFGGHAVDGQQQQVGANARPCGAFARHTQEEEEDAVGESIFICMYYVHLIGNFVHQF